MGIKNVITNNLNGYLVNNREEWIRILTKLCDDVDLRNYVGKNGRKHIEKFYSVDAISKKYLNVINNFNLLYEKVYLAGSGGMLGEAFYDLFKKDYNVLASDIDVNEDWLHFLDLRF